MPQNQASGAAADKWGRTTACKIAAKIGATMLSPNSNMAKLNGKYVVIKCVGRRTRSVGVTFKMLRSLYAVIAALQMKDGSFELWSLTKDIFATEMRNTRSRGDSAGKVGQVQRSVFSTRGKFVRTVRIT